jgi:hypothetical protein
MPGQPLSKLKKILLLLLPLLAFASWKLGQPNPAPAGSKTGVPSKTADRENGEHCCQKPPSRAALLQTSSAPGTPTPPSSSTISPASPAN